MKAMDFCSGWTCKHLNDPGPGAPVLVPHDAMLREARNEDAAGGVNTGWYEGFDYVYEKHFTPGEELRGKTMLLEFEGVYRHAEVWVNGEKALFRPYGYTNFYVDVTDRLHVGEENELRVICRNADQPNSRWYSGAGIYRPVTLWTADKAHIAPNGVRVKTLSTKPAKVSVAVDTTAAGQVEIALLDGSRVLAQTTCETAGKVCAELTLPGAQLWSPKHPQLYTCRVRFGTDELVSTFGVRSLTWGENGICLNGEHIILQGACIHHDNGVLGACCFADAEERKIRLMKQNGYNAVRSAHNPCSKALLDACDRLGMLVMDEYIDHWYIHKTEYDYVAHFMDWWKKDLTDMVDKDYNHPCVILYSTGNEVSETAQDKGIELTQAMTAFLHDLDDTRPVTCGVNIFFNFLSSIGFGVYSDEKAAREAALAEKKKTQGGQVKKKKAVGSQFFNDVAGLLGAGFMKTGATLHGCDVKTRDAFAAMDVAGYNYGIKRYRHDLKKYPERLILGSETFCADAYKFRELAKKEPRLVGDFVWAGMDYLGECGVGAWEYHDYAPQFSGLGWATAGSGRVDLNGRPLGEALYTRVALEADKGPYMAVCPVDHTGEKHSPSAWKMSNALPSWTWTGCEGRKANVEVYARCHSAALLLNGKEIARKKAKNDCILRFTCVYAPGTLEAVTYDAAGKETGRCRLTTAGQETRLAAEPECKQVRPGGLCYIRLRYTDKKGEGKPLNRGRIRVTVEGGTLLGLGHACPFNPDGYVKNETDTYFGEALAVVLAEEGKAVTLRAEDGTLNAECVVPVKG